MLKGWQFWLLTLLALAAAALAAVNMWLVTANRTLQTEVSARAQYVQQTAQLELLYREIVKALADLAVKNNDQQLRLMLGAQGITINAPAAAPAAATGSPDAKGKGGK